MLEIISNEQRKFLGLQEIDPNWKQLDVESQNFQDFKVTIFVDDFIVKKCIIYGEKRYKEIQLDEELTKNLDAIINENEDKKTSSLDSIINKTVVGMSISFDAPNITIFNGLTQKKYYSNFFENKSGLNNIEDFKNWVNEWCKNSTAEDLTEIQEFANQSTLSKINYKEGDVLKNQKFWDCMMGTPIIASLYHILTENKNVEVSELEQLNSFPSEIIMDNNLVLGDYEIIGNVEVDYSKENLPVMYGKELTVKNTTFLQIGKNFYKLDNTTPLYNNFKYNGVNLNLGFDIDLMKQCIEEDSNQPYYEKGPFFVKNDLRNPKNAEALSNVLNQFNLK